MDIHMSDSSPDNTKVVKIMGDFHEFLTAQKQLLDGKPVVSNIPFKLSGTDNDGQRALMSQASDVVLRVKMKQIETNFASAEKAYMKANDELESRCEKLTSQNLQLQEKFDKLQEKMKQQTLQALSLHDELRDAREDKDNQISKWENSFMRMEKLKQETDERLSNEAALLSKQNNELSAHNLHLQSENNLAMLQLEETRAHMEQYKSKWHEAMPILKEQEKMQATFLTLEQEVHELRQRLSRAEDAETLAKALKDDLNRFRMMEEDYRNLVDQNKRLKENQDNCALLREQLFSINAKLARAEAKCTDFTKFEVQNSALMAQLKEVEANSVKKEVVFPLQCQVESLRHQLQVSEEKRASLETDLSLSEKKFMEEKSAVTILNDKICELNADASSRSAQLIRLRKRTGLLAKERDSIREILQSYDAELTMTSHTTQLNKRLLNAEESNKRLHARIVELGEENKISREEAMHHKLRFKQIESSRPVAEIEPIAPPPCVVAPDAEVTFLKEKVQQLEQERSSLIDKNEELEAWIENGKIKGDYNPDTTKVVHFSMNPAAVAHQQSKQDVADLKEENARLRQKLGQMQEGHEVSMVEVESVKAAKEQLTMAELRNQRLKEVFSKKIQEFRQACYSLTGYRIDSSTDSKYSLVSMYGESETDFLLFQMQPNGEMQLLETEYSKSLEELMNLHLHHQNSIPMFLSALSMNLFSQQTIMEV